MVDLRQRGRGVTGRASGALSELGGRHRVLLMGSNPAAAPADEVVGFAQLIRPDLQPYDPDDYAPAPPTEPQRARLAEALESRCCRRIGRDVVRNVTARREVQVRPGAAGAGAGNGAEAGARAGGEPGVAGRDGIRCGCRRIISARPRAMQSFLGLAIISRPARPPATALPLPLRFLWTWLRLRLRPTGRCWCAATRCWPTRARPDTAATGRRCSNRSATSCARWAAEGGGDCGVEGTWAWGAEDCRSSGTGKAPQHNWGVANEAGV